MKSTFEGCPSSIEYRPFDKANTFLSVSLNTLSNVHERLLLLKLPSQLKISPLSVLTVIAIATLIGMLAGLGPAARAARLDPVEALRYE